MKITIATKSKRIMIDTVLSFSFDKLDFTNNILFIWNAVDEIIGSITFVDCVDYEFELINDEYNLISLVDYYDLRLYISKYYSNLKK